MPTTPDFRLYHSNALDVLAGLLAAEVARLPADGDWLRPDIVLVPQFSMRRWLQQALAERLGICANLRFLTPGEFVELALDRNLEPAPDGDRLAPGVLRWQLLQGLSAAPPPALASFLAGADARARWHLAGALADTFEKYQAWRRDLLLRWEAGADAGDWQADLWRRLARGRAHRARRIGDYLRRFGEGGESPAGLPPRLFVFACQNVSPDVLRVIASQARTGDQHFYLHTPARAFWGDPERWADYLPLHDDAFLGGEDGLPNPLLAAWGRAGRDFISSIASGEALAARFEAAAHYEPDPASLLGRMQADVLDNRAPLAGDAGAGWPRSAVARGDGSLQFHACHTRLREVQVLHDQLRALLEAKAPDGEARLQPRDIAVLAPDIDAYAPHIEAVFGGALGSAREIPYTIADTSPLASAPVAEAFVRLLELPLRPLTASDAIDLLAVPALATRFDFDQGDRGLVEAWLEQAGARWGLDGADRERHGAPPGNAFTFEFALDRLLLGYASDAEDDIAGATATVAPWPHLEGQAATTLDGLLRFLALVRGAATRLAGPHPPATWAQVLGQLLDAAFEASRDGDDAVVLARLRDCIAGLARDAAAAGYDTPVEHAVVLDHVRAELGRADPRAPFLSGGVCFGLMVPMRLVPFRVTCLLGMDDLGFPNRDAREPLNRIVQALDGPDRQVGDPSRRDADRYLFLQQFTGAGRVFYLSWCGMDPRDGSECEPSVVVSELLDAAVQYHALPAGADPDHARDGIRKALVVRHALQPFSPAAFGAPLPDETGIEPRRFSYDGRWRDAGAHAGPDGVGLATPPPFAGAALPRTAVDGAMLAIDRLRSALSKPHRAYLRDGLDLRLPDEEPPLATHEPFGRPGPLARWALRQQVFEAWMRGRVRPDASVLHAHLLAHALVAPGADGLDGVDALLTDVAPFVQCALDEGFAAESRVQPVAVAVGPRWLQGVLAGVHARDGREGPLRVALRPEGRHGGHALRHGLDWLLASLHGQPLFEILASDGEVRLVVREPLRDRAGILASLQALVALREDVLRAPLPFLPKSGFDYLQALEAARAKTGAGADDAALREAAMDKAGKRWCGDDNGGVGEAGADTRLALRGRDPFVDGDAASRARFQAIAGELFGAFAAGRPLVAEALL